MDIIWKLVLSQNVWKRIARVLKLHWKWTGEEKAMTDFGTDNNIMVARGAVSWTVVCDRYAEIMEIQAL